MVAFNSAFVTISKDRVIKGNLANAHVRTVTIISDYLVKGSSKSYDLSTMSIDMESTKTRWMSRVFVQHKSVELAKRGFWLRCRCFIARSSHWFIEYLKESASDALFDADTSTLRHSIPRAIMQLRQHCATQWRAPSCSYVNTTPLDDAHHHATTSTLRHIMTRTIMQLRQHYAN